MMDETMVERVARADAEFCNRDFNAMGAADKRRFRDRAAFIIKAMREPTDAMVTALDDQLTRWVREEGDAKDVFIAAIDAALAKGDER